MWLLLLKVVRGALMGTGFVLTYSLTWSTTAGESLPCVPKSRRADRTLRPHVLQVLAHTRLDSVTQKLLTGLIKRTGSTCIIYFWERTPRSRLSGIPQQPTPVPQLSMSPLHGSTALYKQVSAGSRPLWGSEFGSELGSVLRWAKNITGVPFISFLQRIISNVIAY